MAGIVLMPAAVHGSRATSVLLRSSEVGPGMRMVGGGGVTCSSEVNRPAAAQGPLLRAHGFRTNCGGLYAGQHPARALLDEVDQFSTASGAAWDYIQNVRMYAGAGYTLSDVGVVGNNSEVYYLKEDPDFGSPEINLIFWRGRYFAHLEIGGAHASVQRAIALGKAIDRRIASQG